MNPGLVWIYWLAGGVSIGLFAYLLYALFNAEEVA
ncbi:K(+)-transporting ATPase subunit F [Chitinimonas viridis]|uniref:K(+)-transporting ATPase subunit F n=1 Tax=Chitinimonas viridis TaxID=664880 RepID=A0ABT8B597_9NEIS|nr:MULTISPECIES: K(+)-transporting ATPase subunit F [Chitinimonas]MBL8507933.1 K(+)-transporting ATPase subunit F [Chitinimonas sp.]MDN3577189.1 K(+)-transporting ATPase subunit F [Chitinimonas viridis]